MNEHLPVSFKPGDPITFRFGKVVAEGTIIERTIQNCYVVRLTYPRDGLVFDLEGESLAGETVLEVVKQKFLWLRESA